MQILSENSVVVIDSDELKTALEEDNGYIYIYFGSNITLTSGITINENKERIVIDGTYLNNRYVYTGINSISQNDTIAVSSTNKKVIVRNIDIIHMNTNGVIYVRGDHLYDGIITEYNNVKFNGVQVGYNLYGKTRIIDCNITIEDTEGVTSQEVCESQNVEIGGNTTIYSSSSGCTLFYYRSDMVSPSITFLPNSRVNLTSVDREFMNGINNLNFSILHDSEVNLTAANGFSAYTIHGARNVLIDERATFNFIENNHQRIPMWNIFGNLTMNEGSNMFVINSYASTPTDNYNIHFKGSNQKIILNNPNSLVMYTKNANVLYTKNSLEFEFNFSRINMWTNSTELSQAGDINNLPDYAWYKKEGLIKIIGNFSNTETIVTSHNLTDDELTKLPDLNNFSFQNKKQLSIGTSNMNIHPISSLKSTISGHTLDFADVMIKYDNNQFVVSADDEGLFEFTLSDIINDAETIEIISCVAGSFIYRQRDIITPHNGELTLHSASNYVNFLLEPISEEPLILPKVDENIVKVIDSRINSSDWKLYVHLSNPLISENGFDLKNALVFKNFDNSTTILNEVPTLVYTGSNNLGNVEVFNVTWSKEKGLLLRLIDIALVANEEYNTKIIWSITE